MEHFSRASNFWVSNEASEKEERARVTIDELPGWQEWKGFYGKSNLASSQRKSFSPILGWEGMDEKGRSMQINWEWQQRESNGGNGTENTFTEIKGLLVAKEAVVLAFHIADMSCSFPL